MQRPGIVRHMLTNIPSMRPFMQKPHIVNMLCRHHT